MSEKMIGVTASMMVRIHDALQAGNDNTVEALADHRHKYGETTKKNRFTALMYEGEINEFEDIMRWTGEHGGVPF